MRERRDPKDKERELMRLIQETHKLAKENYKITRGIRRSMSRSAFLRFLILLFIVISTGIVYDRFISPALELVNDAKNTVNQVREDIDGQINRIETVDDQINRFRSVIDILEGGENNPQ